MYVVKKSSYIDHKPGQLHNLTKTRKLLKTQYNQFGKQNISKCKIIKIMDVLRGKSSILIPIHLLTPTTASAFP